MSSGPCRILFATVLLSAPAPAAYAQSPENVAVVVNEGSPDSQRIAAHYVRARAIPAANVIRIRTPASETIDRAAYAASIEEPVAAAISRQGLQDRILYIVLTKGIPLRIAGTGGQEGTVSSVDSELTLLYRRMLGLPVPVRGRVPNPYYLGTKPVRDARPFTHREQDIYLVSRLDAFTVEEALALIDRAQSPSRDGRIVLDERGGLSDGTGDAWLAEAARRLADLGHGDRVVLEETARGARNIDNVLGYYSWGSNDPANRTRQFGMKFLPGALAATFVSTDGRTFQNPPDTWNPGGASGDAKASFGGSPQTLAGDFIRAGVTGVAGQVSEPYLQSTVRPEILFPTYLGGFNLVEAFYLALPHLSWQAVVVGDPLCTPFPRKTLARADLEEPHSTETDMPGIFGRRRLERLKTNPAGRDAPLRALQLTLAAETRLARGDVPGGIKALEEATELAPVLTNTLMQLATLYDQTGQTAAALDRYRRVVALQPNNAAALNNLAFGLAVHQKAFDEALPLARRAVALAPGNPLLLDTLGWILYLRGDNQEAARVLSAAVQAGPGNAEVRLHAAVVYASTGATAAAELQLKEALRLDPALAGSADARKARELLGTR